MKTGEGYEGQALFQRMDAKEPRMIMLVVPTDQPTEHLETIYASPIGTWSMGDIERRECVWPKGVPEPEIHKRWENMPEYLSPVEEHNIEYTDEMRQRDVLLRAAYEHGFKRGCSAYAEALEVEPIDEEDEDEE